MPHTIYDELIQQKGSAYSSSQLKSWSHYLQPIDRTEGRLAGNSRIWGDASPDVQSRVIDTLIASAQDAGLGARDTAHVLAIARIESGFNPDAAAGTTSASGLGQFIDRTGKSYGLDHQNRFDADQQARALVAHYIDNRELAARRGQGEAHIYKYHHDGPSLDYGGLGLAERKVIPVLDIYTQFVEQQLKAEQTERGQAGMEAHSLAPATFEDAMRVMLPPQAGVTPHITGHYGEHRGERTHGGTDFNYVGGQTGINRAHPVVHSPVAGVVTFSGGDFGTVKIRDAQGHSHEVLHLHGRAVEVGKSVQPGDPVGTMGGRGPRGADQYAQHVHYQLRDPQGALISPEAFWNTSQVSVRETAGAAMTTGVLHQGDRGPDVRELQDTLAGLGFTDAGHASLRADGVFGARTAEAVREFQQAQGLQVDGIAGPDTREALANETRIHRTVESDDRVASAPRATALDALLAAARDGDPATLKAALADFSETTIGQSFQAAQAGHAAEASRNTELAAPQQGECGAR